MKNSFISAVVSGLVLLAPMVSSAAEPNLPEKNKPNNMPKPVAVLVHGAFTDGSVWAKVIPLLKSRGMKVIAVQNPLSGLADDVKVTQRVIDAQVGPVVLVGHSWGGAVITQAGVNEKVKALVYVAANAPSKGESVMDEGKDFPASPLRAELQPDANGYLMLSPEALAKNFAQDLMPSEIRILTSTQQPILAESFTTQLTEAAWQNKPSYYIVAAKDRAIPPELQKAIAKKINAKTAVVQTSHLAMLAQPAPVARVILKAAQDLKKEMNKDDMNKNEADKNDANKNEANKNEVNKNEKNQ